MAWDWTGVHLFLLPPRDATHHSQVLYWQTHHKDAYPYPGLQGQLFQWNPDYNNGVCQSFPSAMFSPTEIPAPPDTATGSDVFCTGHARLADGRLLVAGGTEAGEVGTKTMLIYDPFANQWSV